MTYATVLGVVSLRRSCAPPFDDARASRRAFASSGTTVSHPSVHQPEWCTLTKAWSRQPQTHHVARHRVAQPP